MSDEQNNKKRDLLLNTLASVREKLDKVKVDYDSLQRVQGAYRSIFNKGKTRYDEKVEDEGIDEQQVKKLVKEQLEKDILTSDCGIEPLNDFLNEMGCCWLDFFGSDSFSDSKKKQQVFFATLCEGIEASEYRKKHVKKYQDFLKAGVPVDILIQVFFATEKELEQYGYLSRISKEGFVIKLKSGVEQEDKPNYSNEIEKVKQLYAKDKKRNLFKFLDKLFTKDSEEDFLCLDYEAQFEPQSGDPTDGALFLKGVCDINWSLHKEVKYVYFLPIPCPDGSNGLVCFGTKRSLDLEDGKLLNTLSFDILYPFVSSYKTAWQRREIEKESIKSAIAAIMSRNMSHNLGSHFISITKNYFDALIDVDGDNQAIYRGVKFALQYIQERMDFIATITSNDAYPFGAVNAKAQIFDELTPDDVGVRHNKKSLNFLMDFLVLSEKVSKNSYINAKTKQLLSDGKIQLKLMMGYENDKGEAIFWESEEKAGVENQKRDDLTKINFAIPGGLLGRHAVFSIVENIIRNAAKHGQDKIASDFKINMLYTNDEHLVIYDNKEDRSIRDTVDDLNKKLQELKMYNDDGSFNHDNKGLKEILICAVWLQKGNIFEVLRLKNYDNFVKIIAVDKNGKELKDGVRIGYLGYRIHLERFQKSIHINNEITLPDNAEIIDLEVFKSKLNSVKSDIVCADKDYKIGDVKLSQIFPRFWVIPQKEYNDNKDNPDFVSEILHKIVEKNCKIKTNDVQMVLSTDKRKDFIGQTSPIVFYEDYKESSKDDFLFLTHAGKSKWSKFDSLYFTKSFENKYIDSISGGDFTHTLVQASFVNDPYNLWKIYESVKTRFIIIDERVFEQYRSKVTDRDKISNHVKKIQKEILEKTKKDTDLVKYVFRTKKILGELPFEDNDELVNIVNNGDLLEKLIEKDIEQQYLERKGIFIFSCDNDNNQDKHQGNQYEMRDLSYYSLGCFDKEKKKFIPRDGRVAFFKNSTQAPTTFLTIHLGLIDKIKGSFTRNNDKDEFDESSIVECLKDYFGAQFVSIHSGRGGFDVRESLKRYVFQSYSAIENPLHNCKFLLSQQFYNLRYDGKL